MKSLKALFTHRLFMPYVSCGLGVLSLMGVFCFYFPELLTSQEFRKVYKEGFARHLLLFGIASSFILGTLSILKEKGARKTSLTGLGTSTVALLLGGSTIKFNQIHQTPYSLGLDWFIISLFFSALVFVPLEHFYARREIDPLRIGWRTDVAYFFTSHVFVQFVLIMATASTTFVDTAITINGLKDFVQSLPFIAQFIMAIFMADMFQATLHRVYHRTKRLWKVHSVHHSSPDLDWLAGSRVHFLETILTRSFVLVPLIVCGFSQSAVNAYAIVIGLQAVVAHSNIGINFRWLEYVIVLPRYHHWHHARHIEYWDKNYAIHLPVVDMIMRTFKLPKDGAWPEEYGVLKPEQVPNGYMAQHLMPLKPLDTSFEDYVGKKAD